MTNQDAQGPKPTNATPPDRAIPAPGAAPAPAQASDIGGRAIPIGASLGPDGTRFVVYATTAQTCSVRLFDGDQKPLSTHLLPPASEYGPGFFAGTVGEARAGSYYKFVLDDKELPDPYAKFLPFGVHGPAEVMGPRPARKEPLPPYRPLAQHVIYEIHVGTFTKEGTYAAAAKRLAEVSALGITAIELMPLAAFAGQRGWGYDGVALFAPFAPYGRPEELCAFLDEAHRHGLSVFLDVVYNHFGPAGNYIGAYSPDYFNERHVTGWGPAPDYTRPAMRNLALENVQYWLSDFGFDGLRLDATHAILDESEMHILRQLTDYAHALSPRRLMIAEDERNDPSIISKCGFDAVWADDFHHQVRVTLTRETDGYYAAYSPGVDGLAEVLRKGWLFEGQVYPVSNKNRGKKADGLPASAFVYCIQNHDQIGNRALGERLDVDTTLDHYCAVSTLLLALPMTPLIFMGQEWAASSPFIFFTDHDSELGPKVSAGRREEFKGFKAFSDPEVRHRLPDPQAKESFERSRLNWEERHQGPHERVLSLYRRLLHLRKSDTVLRESGRADMTVSVSDGLLVVERRASGGERRLIVVNLGDQERPLPRHSGLNNYSEVIFTSRAGGQRPDPVGQTAIAALVPPATALVIALSPTGPA